MVDLSARWVARVRVMCGNMLKEFYEYGDVEYRKL
jgi:hypothetical protein